MAHRSSTSPTTGSIDGQSAESGIAGDSLALKATTSPSMGPVFSPDGQWIAYHGASASESADQTHPDRWRVADDHRAGPSTLTGMSWDESGIVYSDGRNGIFRVSPNGGTPEQLVRLEDEYRRVGPAAAAWRRRRAVHAGQSTSRRAIQLVGATLRSSCNHSLSGAA